MKKILPVISALLTVLLFGCDNSLLGNLSSGITDNTVNVTGINVSPDVIELDIAQNSSTKSAQINAYVIPANASNQKIGYDSSSPEIADVNENGVVTAHAVGVANITAASLANVSIFKTVTVIVSNSDTGETPDIDKVIAIEVNTNNVELDLNASKSLTSYQLEAYAKPDSLNESLKTLSYSSSNPDIADVDNTGKITAYGVGDTVITIKSDSNPEIIEEVNVKVVDTTGNENGDNAVININTTSINLDLENTKTFQIEAYTANENGANIGGVTYKSVNEQIAAVTPDGLVTAVAKGYTFINITSQEYPSITTSVEVIVNEKEEVTQNYKINIEPSTITLEKDKQVALRDVANITTTPAMTGSQFLSAKSNNSTILNVIPRVDTIQLIPLQTGNTTINISLIDFNGTYATITVPVYIKEAGSPDVTIYPDNNYAVNADSNKDKIYLKIKFDAYSNSGDLYQTGSYLRDITFSNYNETCNGSTPCNAEFFTGNDKGFIWNIGYCEKYGCVQGASSVDNAKIAKYKMGTTHYESNNNAFISIAGKSGKITQPIYVIFYKSDRQLYVRQDVNFEIDLNSYNPQTHKNIAKYTLTVNNKNITAVFDGFENK